MFSQIKDRKHIEQNFHSVGGGGGGGGGQKLYGGDLRWRPSVQLWYCATYGHRVHYHVVALVCCLSDEHFCIVSCLSTILNFKELLPVLSRPEVMCTTHVSGMHAS